MAENKGSKATIVRYIDSMLNSTGQCCKVFNRLKKFGFKLKNYESNLVITTQKKQFNFSLVP